MLYLQIVAIVIEVHLILFLSLYNNNYYYLVLCNYYVQGIPTFTHVLTLSLQLLLLLPLLLLLLVKVILVLLLLVKVL